MERAVIQSDLKKQEIQPQPLVDHYLVLLKEDIKKTDNQIENDSVSADNKTE